ncbi:MAG: sulfatase [Planctomycetota bacterium]|nr:sulfatase [Planctomycetota bacterium]
MRSILRLLLGAGLLALGGSCGSEPDELPPNLLFISIDTLRADALGSYGATWGGTPYLDSFAEANLRFASAWAHTPKTAPSHMTMFTGLPPRAHGLGNQRSSGNKSVSEDISTLAEVLSAAGYRTGAVTSGGNVKGYLGFERGFEVFNEKPNQPPGKLADMQSWIRGAASPEPGQAARPWFAFFHTYAVHDPYLPPKQFIKKFVEPGYTGKILGDPISLSKAIREGEDLAPWAESHAKAAENFWARVDADDPADLEHLRQLYLAGVAGFDFLLKGFMADLEAAGLLENTIVVITSDHGEEFGEHGDTRHNGVWREHLHVPLLVAVPDSVRGGPDPDRNGRVIDAPVRHMDLMPSLLDLMGLEPEGLVSHAMLGESWAAWVDDPGAVTGGRAIYSEHRSKLERPLDLWSLRYGDHLLIQPEPGADPLLIDLGLNALELGAAAGFPGLLDPDSPTYAELLDLQRRELGRFQREAEDIGAGPGVELDAAARAELEALGYR